MKSRAHSVALGERERANHPHSGRIARCFTPIHGYSRPFTPNLPLPRGHGLFVNFFSGPEGSTINSMQLSAKPRNPAQHPPPRRLDVGIWMFVFASLAFSVFLRLCGKNAKIRGIKPKSGRNKPKNLREQMPKSQKKKTRETSVTALSMLKPLTQRPQFCYIARLVLTIIYCEYFC